jgi:hypothetical protein
MDRVVMFLLKELTTAETIYWPTELETAALVFVVKKTQHLIEANHFPTIIQMSSAFVEEWLTGLREDRHYRAIFAELEGKIGDADQVESYSWVLKKVENHLLLFVYKGDRGGLRACIPTTH